MDSEQVFAVEVVGFLVLFSLVALWYWWPGLLRLGTVEALTAASASRRSNGWPDSAGCWCNRPQPPTILRSPGGLRGSCGGGAGAADDRGASKTAPMVDHRRMGLYRRGTWRSAERVHPGLPHRCEQLRTGATWFIFTVLVPALLVTHVMIAMILIRRRDRAPHRLTQGERSMPDGP